MQSFRIYSLTKRKRKHCLESNANFINVAGPHDFYMVK